MFNIRNIIPRFIPFAYVFFISGGSLIKPCFAYYFQSGEVTASERVHTTIRNQSDLVTPSTEQYALDNRCQTAMETLLTRDETHDIPRHNVPPNMHQNRLSMCSSVLADRPILVSTL